MILIKHVIYKLVRQLGFMVTKEDVLEKLKSVQDPEIRMNIVDMGLVYEVDIDSENNVSVKMTFTSPGCPVGGAIISEIQAKVAEISNVKSVEVDIVWDPQWSPEKMSEEAKLELGLN